MIYPIRYPSEDPLVTRLTYKEIKEMEVGLCREAIAALFMIEIECGMYPTIEHLKEQQTYENLAGIPWAARERAQVGCLLYGLPITVDDLSRLFLETVIKERRDDIIEMLLTIPEFKLCLGTWFCYEHDDFASA